ncbi:MAG: hypothetical protein ACN4GG_04725 [Akkermansiaceae bacterium]
MMSDQDDQDDNKAVPEGMVKKVRRVKGKRRSKQSKSSGEGAQSLLEQGKSLLESMQHDDEETGHVAIQDQLKRLKERDENRDLDEVWGSKKKSSSWIWMSLIGVLIPVIGIAVGISILNKADNSKDVELIPNKFELDTPMETSLDQEAHAWFHNKQNSRNFLAEARDILKAINEADSPSDITKFLRPSPNREKNPVDLAKWDVPVIINSSSDTPWSLPVVVAEGDTSANARGVLSLALKREDQEKIAAFFVYEGDKLLLDWDATTGWCEIPWSEIRAAKPRKAKILRARILKKAGYDAIKGDVSQSGYLLSSDDGSQFIFGFIPLDSDENQKNDKALRDLLNYGQLTTKLKGNLRVTVKVRYGDKSGRGDRFEIVDYLHEGWVKP